ncbi:MULTISPECIES: transcriptional repressor [unclassified Aureimonas]|uniref:transcriptional repressor n=1 Tax=unclassified Aureimonas TaxID=2615206 RepID=UPI00071F649A|nr:MULTISPECIES: transcriptional repressor [unclassified Aureimonas]ALN72545.1 hypothetical protein M673_07450 [Aureimonas sp. AU20]
MKDEHRLTRNETLVLTVLREDCGPQTAYQILDRLRGDGLKAPLQVYRALRSLSDRHLVHRLESLNAFVACNHHHGDHHHAAVFSICQACGRVSEATDPALDEALANLARREGFALRDAAVEMRGLCSACVESGREAKQAS